MTDEPGLAAPAAGESDDDDLDDLDDGLDDDLSIGPLEELDAGLPRHTQPMSSGRNPLHLLWRASGAAAFVTLVAIVVVALAPHLPRPTQPRITPQYIALQAASNAARCLVGASWSHDSRQIAAALSYACRAPYLGQGPLQRNLFLYDASNGRETASFDLDSAISEALTQAGLTSSGSVIYAVDYFATAWSPDDSLLAVQFAVYGQNLADVGLALVSLTGPSRGQVRLALETPRDASVAPSTETSLLPVERWDLQSWSHSTIYLLPALAYSWLSSDVLVADEPLMTNGSAPTSAEPAAPLGNPIGGQSFSLWRTGALTLINATACGSTGTPPQPLATPYAELSLNTTVWSPDGHYLLNVTVPSRLPIHAAIPSGLNPCSRGPAPDQIPSAPLHDKGLASALTLLDPHGDNYLTLAWSPDGKRLAVATLADAQGAGSVTVYDCATGAALQRFTGDQFEADAAMNDIARDPIWSPDGAHLLLTISAPVSKLVILGPQALGG